MTQLSLWILREILNNHKKNNRDLEHHLPPNFYRNATNSSLFAHASEINTIKTSNFRRSIISYSSGFRRPALSAALIFKEEKKSSCVAKVYVSVIWSGNRLNCTCHADIRLPKSENPWGRSKNLRTQNICRDVRNPTQGPHATNSKNLKSFVFVSKINSVKFAIKNIKAQSICRGVRNPTQRPHLTGC